MKLSGRDGDQENRTVPGGRLHRRVETSSETPLTALAIASILAEAGVPDGFVNVIPASRSSGAVQTSLRRSEVRKHSFKGSTQVGRLLLSQANGRVIPCSIELGGNAPFLVLSDADLDATVEGALIAKMRNGGEACTAANRFYAHESIVDSSADS